MRETQNPTFSACDRSGQLTVFTREHHTQGKEESSPNFTDFDVFRKNDRPTAFAMELLICVKWTFLEGIGFHILGHLLKKVLNT